MVQDLTVQPFNTCYSLVDYFLPDGILLHAELPPELAGSHYGPTLRPYLVNQYQQCRVTQPLLREQLRDFIIFISAGQVDVLLTQNLAPFLAQGLLHSPAVTVDDTTYMHMGKLSYVLNISGPFFAAYFGSNSKSRLNFLTALHAGEVLYRIDDSAVRCIASAGLSLQQLRTVRQALPNCSFTDSTRVHPVHRR